jgi:hypothetical protein
MPKPELYGEYIYLRVPKGTKDRIKQLMGRDGKPADAMRRWLLDGLDREEKSKRKRPA